jgi:hypothetical protein
MLSDSLTSPSKRNSNMISLYRDSLFSNTIMMDGKILTKKKKGIIKIIINLNK